MKKLIMAAMIAVLGIMFLVPSLGYCDNPFRRDHRPQYVVVRDHGPRDYRPLPVHYNQPPVYVERRHNDDRGGQVAIAALGGIVVGTLIGTVIAGR